MMHNVCGTPVYVAPEILDANPKYGLQVDMWSIGVILFILLCGSPPFFEEDNHKLFAKIRRCDYNFDDPCWRSVSELAMSLVRALLVLDPLERLTAKQFLAHPWCQEGSGGSTHLAEFHGNLSSYNAKRRMKKAIRSVFFTQLLHKQGQAVSQKRSSKVISESELPDEVSPP